MSSLTSDQVRKPSTISFRPISENSRASYHLIFFITGNPGLISYYSSFLSTLRQLLSHTSSKSGSDVFHIYGQSLAGFEQNDRPPPSTSVPYSLEDQINILLQVLNDQTIPSGPRRGQFYESIIPIGHSVGTYIIMEILNRLRKSSSPLKVKGAILLFPTVTHLAQSPSGIRFSSFFRISAFPRGLSLVAKTFLWPIPRPVLKWLVSLLTGMPEDAAETTTRFLISSMGIWQAL
jgi:pimeloyl-ACP methyl ester carboxylesterase